MRNALKLLLKKTGAFFGVKISRIESDQDRILNEESQPDPYATSIHGFGVYLNRGNTYPHITKVLQYFNAPVVELVNQAYKALGRKISFVDVGAATGDTVLLLEQRCSGKVESYFCFEGDEEFGNLLKLNMRQFKNVKIISAILASELKNIPTLVKHHRGSASATGDSLQLAKPLDSFSQEFGNGIDVLKIDVDGFDGDVLKGAKHILTACQPWVIFEWHPALIERARTDYRAPFQSLMDCGYNRFLWFSNTGHFSHFSETPPVSSLENMYSYLLRVNKRCDEHFDIIALPLSAPRIELELAALEYAREVSRSMPVQ